MLTAQEIFAANLKALMDNNSKLSTPNLLAKNCYWLSGGSKKGKRVSIRRFQQVLQEGGEALDHSPTLELVDAVAATFGYEAWLLLVPGLNPASPPELLMRGARRRTNGERPTDHVVAAKTHPKRRPKSGTSRAR